MNCLFKKVVLLFLLCHITILVAGEKLSGKKIHSFSITGLKRTDKNFLSRFIKIKVGEALDQTIIKQDVQRLKNLEIFHSVTYKIQKFDDESVQVIIKVKEKFTILPVLRGGLIGNIFWIQPGFIDYHFLGNKSLLSLLYRYYQRHSIEGFYKNQFLFNDDWGFSGEVAYLATTEPTDAFEPGFINLYNVDIIKVNTTINYNLSIRQHLLFTLGYLNELYVKISSNALGPDRFQQNKLLFKSEYYLDYINYNNILQDGFSNLLILEVIYNLPRQLDFFKLYNEYKHFFTLFKNDTIAIRNRFGLSSNFTSPYPPFVIDSFLNVRGAGNRTHRGYIENTINLEYRYLLGLTSWLSIQIIAFFDNALLLSVGSRVLFFDYAGGGIRIILPNIYNGILAFDYAVNLQDTSQHGFLLKIGQYF